MGKIAFEPVSKLPESRLTVQREYSRGLGLPEIVPNAIPLAGAVAPSLAVVGGSPEIAGQVDQLRAFEGEIWAINGTWQWCRNQGIEATFYRIDPNVPPEDSQMLDGVTHAILADMVEPYVFDALIDNGAKIEMVRLGAGEGEHLCASTAAGTAPLIATHRGHRHVTIFGCESSFGEQTHAFKAERPNLVWVECGGEEYVTSPQMIMQAEWLAEMARTCPQYITIASGGFLGALTKHGDYNVTHVCRALAEVVNG